MSSPAGFEPIAEVTANERAQSGCGRAEELRASLLRGLADVTHGNFTRQDDLLAGDDSDLFGRNPSRSAANL